MSAHPERSAASKRRGVEGLAFAATFLSRAVAGAVVESLRAELWLTDQALGTLVSAFSAAYAVALPAGAVLGGERRRRHLLAAGLLACGLATAASAAAVGFWSLVAARMAAGAAAGLATGILVHLLLERGQRGVLLTAAGGLAASYALGGLCSRAPGWRGAFVGGGVALVAIGVAVLRAGAPAPSGARADPWSALRIEGVTALRRLALDGARLLTLLAAVVGVAAASALAFWLPAFLQRTRGVPRVAAGLQLGAAVLASGFAGAALGRAWLRRSGAGPGAGGWMAAGGAAIAAAGMGAALLAASPLVVLPGVMVALLGTFTAARGAAAAVGRGAFDPALVALALLLVHGAGETLGAFGLGAVADRASFGRALYLLPCSLLVAAALWAAATTATLAGGRRQVAPRS